MTHSSNSTNVVAVLESAQQINNRRGPGQRQGPAAEESQVERHVLPITSHNLFGDFCLLRYMHTTTHIHTLCQALCVSYVATVAYLCIGLIASRMHCTPSVHSNERGNGHVGALSFATLRAPWPCGDQIAPAVWEQTRAARFSVPPARESYALASKGELDVELTQLARESDTARLKYSQASET